MLAAFSAIAGHVSGVWTFAAFAAFRSLSVIYPPAPGFPMDLMAIRVFGPVAGFVTAECGIMLGASVAFAVARAASPALAASVVEKWKLLVYLKQRLPSCEMTRAEQFFSWLTIRSCCNPLFDPICYIAGLTSSDFWPYFFGSLFGNLPSTLLFFAVERHLSSASPLYSILVAITFCALVIHVAKAFLQSAGEV
jgi:uncharacterized membrane protein YdjX (TVP38/TMEM64 family)